MVRGNEVNMLWATYVRLWQISIGWTAKMPARITNSCIRCHKFNSEYRARTEVWGTADSVLRWRLASASTIAPYAPICYVAVQMIFSNWHVWPDSDLKFSLAMRGSGSYQDVHRRRRALICSQFLDILSKFPYYYRMWLVERLSPVTFRATCHSTTIVDGGPPHGLLPSSSAWVVQPNFPIRCWRRWEGLVIFVPEWSFSSWQTGTL